MCPVLFFKSETVTMTMSQRCHQGCLGLETSNLTSTLVF